jgi:hypothetical protein
MAFWNLAVLPTAQAPVPNRSHSRAQCAGLCEGSIFSKSFLSQCEVSFISVSKSLRKMRVWLRTSGRHRQSTCSIAEKLSHLARSVVIVRPATWSARK